MKRLIKKIAYRPKTELEKLIGYLVTRSSGLKLNETHFKEICEHFEDNGGTMTGIKGKDKNKSKDKYYEMLRGSIDHILKKHNMKKKK